MRNIDIQTKHPSDLHTWSASPSSMGAGMATTVGDTNSLWKLSAGFRHFWCVKSPESNLGWIVQFISCKLNLFLEVLSVTCVRVANLEMSWVLNCKETNHDVLSFAVSTMAASVEPTLRTRRTWDMLLSICGVSLLKVFWSTPMPGWNYLGVEFQWTKWIHFTIQKILHPL